MSDRPTNPGADPAWHAIEARDVLARLETTAAGLSSSEAARRLETYGKNRLRNAAPIRPWAILFAQFRSLLVVILLVAAALSAATGEAADSVAILAIVVINAAIGFFQEYQAETSLAALKKLTRPNVRVRRDGKTIVVPSALIVPGDVVEVEAGDLVPADSRLLEAVRLRAVEAPLTGESVPVAKKSEAVDGADVPLGDRASMIWTGTSVADGRGLAVVVATGMKTEIGRIAKMLVEAGTDEQTPLQKSLAGFARYLAAGALGVVALLFGLGLLRGMPVLELFLSAVALAVAAVPEGLPAVVTIALAVGVQRMAKRRSIVRKLAAVETLGSASVICTDKTGTLTVGEMTARALVVAGRVYEVSGEGYGPEGRIHRAGAEPKEAELVAAREGAASFVACNGAHLVEERGIWSVAGDPTEGALLSLGAKLGMSREAFDRDEAVVAEFPFDSDRRRMTIVRKRSGGGFRAYVKGAPDVVLPRCVSASSEGGVAAFTDDDRRRIETISAELSGRALRLLASAWRDFDVLPEGGRPEDVEKDLVFGGLVGMYDPPRPEVRAAIATCREAGVRIVMITGDHPGTARAVAREIGLSREGDIESSGRELDAMSDEDLRSRVGSISVYARASAAHKLRIVRALKSTGAVTAMTGDGVNDAPAVKGADIGIAMGRTGTEVTKAASDMVLLDDDFASIVAAVEEGRGVYANIRKALQYLLAGNVGEIAVMAAAILAGLPLPLLPMQLLWINLVTDGLPALCLATDPIDRDLMKRPPRARASRMTDGPFLRGVALAGGLTAGTVFSVYVFALGRTSEEAARSYAFTCLVFIEVLKAFVYRSETRTIWQIGLTTNIRLFVVAAFTLGLQVAAPSVDFLRDLLHLVPAPASHMMMIFGAALLPPTILELIKFVPRKRANT